MKPTRITLSNFARHAATDYSPNGGRLVILTGDSGSGKSSLVSDSLRYAFFGQARARAPHLLRRGASDMSVSIELDHGGERYRIVRGYSSRAGGKAFAEFAIANPGGSWRPLTGDTIAQTDARIAETLRLDAATFTTSAMLVQGQIQAFADAKATERKRVFGAALNIEHPWSEAEAATREKARTASVEADVVRKRIGAIEGAIAARGDVVVSRDAAQHRLEAIEIEAGLVEVELAEHRSALESLAAKIGQSEGAEAEVARLATAVDASVERWKAARQRQRVAQEQEERAAATLAQKDAIDAATASVPVIEAELAVAKEAAAAYAARGAEVERIRGQHRDAARDVRAAEQTWVSLTAQRDDTTVCPECGAEIPAGGQALEDRITAAADAAESARSAAAALPPIPELGPDTSPDPWAISQRLAEAQGIAAGAAAIAEAHHNRHQAVVASEEAARDEERAEKEGRIARSALDGARERAAGVEPLRAERASHAREVERLTTQAQALTTETREQGAARTRAEALLDQLDAAAAEREALTTKLASISRELTLLGRLVTAFSAKGIPARIIDSAIPELEADANALLDQLRPGLSIGLRTQRAKARGDGMVEALDVIVRDDDSGEAPIETFSGGEKTSISLALAVGISRVAARRSGAAVRSMVIDEPDGLDPALRRSFGQALKVLAHTGELDRITVVTHTPDLVDFGDEVYLVTKDAAGSHVELVES